MSDELQFFVLFLKWKAQNSHLFQILHHAQYFVITTFPHLPGDYQDHIIERYKNSTSRLDDINSGFEPHTFDESTYARWKPFYKGAWRFAFDEMREEKQVKNMFRILGNEPAGKKRVYVLIGNEPFEQCFERVMKELLVGWRTSRSTDDTTWCNDKNASYSVRLEFAEVERLGTLGKQVDLALRQI